MHLGNFTKIITAKHEAKLPFATGQIIEGPTIIFVQSPYSFHLRQEYDNRPIPFPH